MLIELIVTQMAKLALLIVTLAFSVVVHAQVTQTTLNLTAGWNLVGNGYAASFQVSDSNLFGDQSKVTSVWKWVPTNSSWAFYAPSMTSQQVTDYAANKGYAVLATVSGDEGFWVNAKTPFSVVLQNGTHKPILASTVLPSLAPGWNLVSIGEERNASDFDMTTLWAWDTSRQAWYFYAPNLSGSGGLASYIQNKGYLDFAAEGRKLGTGVGFWVNKPQYPTLSVTEFSQGLSTPVPFAGVKYIAAGPDGNMWFTEHDGNRIGRITPEGVITEFSLGLTPGAQPGRITKGPDGNMWFTEERQGRIGRITMNGQITEFSDGISSDAGFLFDITSGPDGNLWFTEAPGNRVGRITPQGVVTEFKADSTGGIPSGIAAGPDGNLWVAVQSANKILRVTPAGAVTEFTTGLSPNAYPFFIVAGPDGNLWFTEHELPKIGRITPAGVITEFDIQAPARDITVGSDGNLWTKPNASYALRITTTGVSTQIPASTYDGSSGIASGPDGNLWLTTSVSGGAAAVPDKIVRLSTSGAVGEFSDGISNGVQASSPDHIITRSDGNLWFVRNPYGHVFRATPSGTITEFDAFAVGKIIEGPDGALWAKSGSSLNRITINTAGIVDQQYFYPPGGYSVSRGVTIGSDGAIWFLDAAHGIGRMTIAGDFSFFSSGITDTNSLSDMTLGPDGNLWFTEWSANIIGRITPSGEVAEFTVGLPDKAGPAQITAGPDGNLWFIAESPTVSFDQDQQGNMINFRRDSRIGRITPSGVITTFGFDKLNDAGLAQGGITSGPDGNLWFVGANSNLIRRITPAGLITEFKIPGFAADSGLSSITTGPDGKMWFTEKNANKIGTFSLPSP